MKQAVLVMVQVWMAAAWVALPVLIAGEQNPPNVLLIMIDDQNDWIGCLKGHPQARTPAIDALAARGTLFTNAHCQSPLCNPSRTSMMTGLRPTTTGIYGLAPWFRALPEFKKRVTLPQALEKHGYETLSVGKIYHGGYPPKTDRESEFNAYGNTGGMPYPARKIVETPDAMKAVDWGVIPGDDRDQPDWKAADWAIEQLQKKREKPFFLALGFVLPHVPCFASQKWFDLYPEAELQLPPVKEDDRSDVPGFAWQLHWKLPEPRLSWLKKTNQWSPLVRAYLASTSLMDRQVGRVMAALEKSGKAENTIVVLVSDHGWHLGEKGISGKNSLWERSTRVPLIFAGPGVKAGQRCAEPAELLDVYPTLLALTGTPEVEGLEGHSLMPQLHDAGVAREWPAVTSHCQGNDSVRSKQFRYIRYADGSEEFYDLERDPNEWTNLIGVTEHAEKIAAHRAYLPKNPRPPAPGSASRILIYDPATKSSIWEGKPVVPAELEK